MTLLFPKDFKWGAAASAPQTEGVNSSDGKSMSTWDYWYSTNPEKFDSNIGPSITSNVLNQYLDDSKLMKEMNLNSYRTSISWTRLLPDGKTVNQKAVEYYRNYFKALRDNGIEPIINLFHFDMPMWLMDLGGWTHYESSDFFATYAKTCVELFGDLIQSWVTFNEPIVHVECSYIYQFHYPAIVDFKKAIEAGYNTILAHAKAIKEMKKADPNCNVGTILNITPIYAASESKRDKQAAKIADLLNVRSFLDAMVKGEFQTDLVSLLKEYDLMVETRPEDLVIIKENTAMFLGVNYYQPKRVQAPKITKKQIVVPEDLYEHYEWPLRVINPYRGWEIFPEALYDIAKLIQNEYDNIPWYVSENGMGVADEVRFADGSGVIQDTYRIDFLQTHLEYLSKAIQEGANCFGYHMWTFVDCWSWLNGYRNRYGFYSVDLNTQKRTPKLSSYWFKDLIKENQER